LDNPFILSDPFELPSGVSVINKRNGEGASVQGINAEANFAFPAGVIFQLGATYQTARYQVEEEIWAPGTPDDKRPPTMTDRLLRTPDFYGFFTATYNPTDALALSWSGVFTGPMDIPHIIEPDSEYTIIERTPSFLENNIRLAYTFKLDKDFNFELFGGVQNLFNAYQDDFDIGAERDAGYIYGPSRPRTYFAGLKFSLQ
jgi:outer membrane receptor for ferrienterochelin and colicins